MRKLFETKEAKEHEARKARAEMRAERSVRAFERQAEALSVIANSIDVLTLVFRGAAHEVQELAKPARSHKLPKGYKFKRYARPE